LVSLEVIYSFVYKETKYYLASTFPDLNITRTTTITTSFMEVIKGQKGGLEIIQDGYA